MSRAHPFLLFCCCIALTPRVPAAPYTPWEGPGPYRYADAPVRHDAAPPPLIAPAENGRRPFELALGFGFGLPHCSDGERSDRCALLGGGLGGDLIGLYRVSPFFAFGGSIGLNRLGGDESEAVFAAVLARVYFLDEGAVDPHLELALGAGSLSTQAATASGPAARVGAGLDFSVSSNLRLGPALDLTTYLADTVRVCAGDGSCVEQSIRRYAHPTGVASLSVRLSIAFGKPM